MNTFEKLPKEKRERIINSAMEVFATHGYHKASVSDIANKAEISKAMVFTYFESKYGCYEYMCEEMMRASLREFNRYKDEIFAETDYFERMILSVRIKVNILKQFPSLLAFAMSVYTERDEAVMSIITKVLTEGYALREMFLSKDIDESKFKDPKDAKKITKIAEWLSKGCADEWSRCSGDVLDSILTDFIDCVLLLKKYIYSSEGIESNS